MFKPIFIIGSGGEGREVLELILHINKKSIIQKYRVLGFIDNREVEVGRSYCGYKVLGNDSWLNSYIWKYGISKGKKISLVLGIGNPKSRHNFISELFNQFYNSDFDFPNIISPTAEIGYDVHIGVGNIIKSGVKLTCNISIGNFNMLSRDVNIGHDCSIKNYNVINPGAIISGNCHIGSENLLGTNCTVVENNIICNKSIIGAGTVVTKKVENGIVVVGVPARKLRDNV